MAANCAGIVGGQLFRSDDLPYYHRGWSIALAFMAVSVVLVLVLLSLYTYSNSRIRKEILSPDSRADRRNITEEEAEKLRVRLYNF